MEDIVRGLIDFLSAGQSAAGLVVLLLSAMIEYVFPPFPGDTVTLFGAFLAAVEGWSVPLVFVAVTAGSVAGATLDYAIGRRLGRAPVESLTGRKRRLRELAAPLIASFERHGAACIAINRFLPGIRALLFVAAGMARLSLWRVLLWGAVSAAVWNALIIGAGFAVGANWPRLLEWLKTYTAIAWVVVGLVVLALIARWALGRRQRPGRGQP
ncbi:MAG TPA: DedA family protein [Polyangia bacterium]|nr:DedA family protein [Polyangia bacterium]